MFGTSGSFGELMSGYIKDPMKTTIVDAQRRDLALKELGSVTDSLKDFNKDILQDIKQLNKLVKNCDSKPEDFDNLFSASLSSHEKEFENIWKQRSTMLTHITADEWQTIISSAKTKEAAKKK